MENRFRFLRPCALGPLRTVDSVCTPAAAAGATQRRLLPLCLGRRPAVVKTNQRRREREKASFFLCCFTMSVDARSSSSPGVLAFAPYHYHCRCALHSILRPSLPVAPPLSPRFSLFPFRCGALDTNTKGVLRLFFSFPSASAAWPDAAAHLGCGQCRGGNAAHASGVRERRWRTETRLTAK